MITHGKIFREMKKTELNFFHPWHLTPATLLLSWKMIMTMADMGNAIISGSITVQGAPSI